MFALLVTLGAFGGCISGLLGIGGAVVMIPLMMTVPQLFGYPCLSMQTVAGLSIVQVFFASVAGIVVHGKNRQIDRRALLVMGLSMAAGALLGGTLSRSVPGDALLVVFGFVAILAFVLMLLPSPAEERHTRERDLNKPLAAAIGSSIGILSGLVGAGGGFILIPMMIYFLKMPMKTAVGTSLGIVFLGSISGMIGKAIAGQIRWAYALALVLGAVPLAVIGAAVSKKTPKLVLRILLIVVIFASCLQTWAKILG